jgi:hypothetical protein
MMISIASVLLAMNVVGLWAQQTTRSPPTPSPTLSEFFISIIKAQAKARGIDPLPEIAENYIKTYQVC